MVGDISLKRRKSARASTGLIPTPATSALDPKKPRTGVSKLRPPVVAGMSFGSTKMILRARQLSGSRTQPREASKEVIEIADDDVDLLASQGETIAPTAEVAQNGKASALSTSNTTPKQIAHAHWKPAPASGQYIPWHPWEQEATAWTNWPNRKQIKLHQQLFWYSENHADKAKGELPGNCYFRALSCIFAGSPDHYAYFRAQHLKYWHEIEPLIKSKVTDLPNGDLFDRLNKAAGDRGHLTGMLGRDGIWQHIEICELTALLYRVQVVLFDNSPKAKPVPKTRTNAKKAQVVLLSDDPAQQKPAKTQAPIPALVPSNTIRSFGPFNRMQIFLHFTGNHFQPLYPAVTRPEEYRYSKPDLRAKSVAHADRHWQYRYDQPTAVPVPFLWRPPPAVSAEEEKAIMRGKR